MLLAAASRTKCFLFGRMPNVSRAVGELFIQARLRLLFSSNVISSNVIVGSLMIELIVSYHLFTRCSFIVVHRLDMRWYIGTLIIMLIFAIV